MTAPVGIIGGSALPKCEGLADGRSAHPKTPFGRPDSPLTFGRLAGRDVCFLTRHGSDHRIAPHRINYRANLRALADAGCESVVGVAAVGGISGEMAPGRVVVPDQLIDYTWGRPHTLLDNARSRELTQIEFAEPYSPAVRQALLESAATVGIRAVNAATLGVTQGPRRETAAEINRLASDDCDIVGMTGMPEASLARETNMAYGCLALVVSAAAGRGDAELIHRQIEVCLPQAATKAESILGSAVAMI